MDCKAHTMCNRRRNGFLLLVFVVVQHCAVAFTTGRLATHASSRLGITVVRPPAGCAGMQMKVAVPINMLSTTSSKLLGMASSVQGQIGSLSSAWKAVGLILLAWLTQFRTKINLKIVTGAVNAMEKGWDKRGTGGAFSRTIEVYAFAFSFAYRFIKSERLKKKDIELYTESKKDLAIVLRDKLLELGPTFIKLGQLLSTRIDVLPREYIKELVLLQDQVPGFDGDRAVEIIEKELGKPIDQLYDTFDRKAIAAASLGQVHVATKNGKKLAVKVQRQGLRKLFDMDLKNIKVLAILLDKFDPKSDGAQRDWVSIYDESARLLYKEIDYKAEANNAIRFRENFADVPWVKVPEVDLDMTTEKVITMEYVPGAKINDIEKIEALGIDRSLLAKRSAEAYLMQLCRHGFFHCDPHPGNVACDAELGTTQYHLSISNTLSNPPPNIPSDAPSNPLSDTRSNPLSNPPSLSDTPSCPRWPTHLL